MSEENPGAGRKAGAPAGSSFSPPSPIGLLRFVGRQVRRPFLRVAAVWRQSIQLRLVATTLLLSLGVVLMLGVVVIGQVRNGLLDAKVKSAVSQAEGGFRAAQLKADDDRDPRTRADGALPTSRVDTGTWLNEMVNQLASSGQGQYSVVALSSGDGGGGTAVDSGASNNRGARATGQIRLESVPKDLQRKVLSGKEYQQNTQLKFEDPKQPPTPGLVVGKQVHDANNNPYELYYLFSFAQEEETLSLVKSTLASAGVFVVVLLGALAWLVVRQVVTPVRTAARIAEQLAAGKLDERMMVSGEDDIALLGESFNEMASNLQKQIRQLEGLSRMQRRFVSDVSHELRTPLTTVRMAADLLYESREDFSPVTSRSAELLQGQLDRFESLLADLLEISRFDAGAAVLDAEPVDLRDLSQRVIDAAAPLAQNKGTVVRIEGSERPVIAEVDPRRIERILRNLVVNAIEHGEGGDVVVLLASSSGAVAVAVRDYGVGLKPGEASRVFNRFWRADPARARTTGGTGLGLSIALEDARLHGGWLQAWGEPGGGSQFRLTLPCRAGSDPVGSPLPLEPEDSRGNRGLRASGVPFRRPGVPVAGVVGPRSAPDGAWGRASTGGWRVVENKEPDCDASSVSPSEVGGTVSHRIGRTSRASGAEAEQERTGRGEEL
jgi:two-component system sensor histidine kinase MtrB